MKTRTSPAAFRPVSITVCLLAAFTSCAPQRVITPVSNSNIEDPSLCGRVYEEVNSYRTSHGARDLPRHPGLDKIALEHSEYLRDHRGTFSLHGKNVSHFGSEARFLVAKRDYQMNNCSENIASTKRFSDPQAAKALVTLWERSPSHEYAMRNPTWSHTGIGTVVDADGTVFATQIFGTYSRSQLTMQDRFTQF